MARSRSRSVHKPLFGDVTLEHAARRDVVSSFRPVVTGWHSYYENTSKQQCNTTAGGFAVESADYRVETTGASNGR